jgi:hypothetical protein
MPQPKKSESSDTAEGDSRMDSISAQLQQLLARDAMRDKELLEIRQFMTLILEQKQNLETPSAKKESPAGSNAPANGDKSGSIVPTNSDKSVILPQPVSNEKSVILANAPPPFSKMLKELVSPYEYWVFIKSFKEYKVKYPAVAHTVHLIQHIATDILNGPFNLTEEITAAAGSLLSDDRIYRAASAYFSLTHTTQRQFLDLIHKIAFDPAPYDKRNINAMQASQPLFSYLANVTHFYTQLKEMLPGAVPREEEYDRSSRTTVKYIVNAQLCKWWPWWSTDIWPVYSRSKERFWTDIATSISDKCRALVATFYPVQALMETLNAFSTTTIMQRNPSTEKAATRSLWQPGYKREGANIRSQPPATRVHMLEDELDENDALEKDVITTDEDDPDILNAISGDSNERLCFAKLIKGECSKSDCPHKHDKASMDAMARTILARPT